jgi:hypothetical protein
MLTLLRGKAEKSVYMQLLCKGSNGLMIIYGQEGVHFSKEVECWEIERRKETKDDFKILINDLWNIVEAAMITTKFKDIFIYGNFGLHEIGSLRDLSDRIDGRLSLYASIQDELVPNGQIIIEKIG